ncbi:g5977 [Coccomyxa elongata]
MADMQKQQQVATAQATVLAAEPVLNAIILSGIDELPDTETEQRITEVLTQDLQLSEPPRIRSVARLGTNRPEGDAKPPKVLVEFDCDKDVLAVLRAARNLRKYNEEAKAAGKLAIGIERSLTEAQRKHKNSIWASFKSARDDGKRAWWRGHRLFIEGEEVFPIGNSS